MVHKRTSPAPLAFRVHDFCTAVGISRTTFYKEVKRGKIRTVSIAGRRLVPTTEVERLLSDEPRKAAADEDAISPAEVWPSRDVPLRYQYAMTSDQLASLGINCATTPARTAALNHILSEGFLAAQEDACLSYSRRKCSYSHLTRYYGPGGTYTNTLQAVEELTRLGLVQDQRSDPGDIGFRSRLRATPMLLEALRGAEFYHQPYEIIQLRNADREFIDYQETDETLRMRRELAEINHFIGAMEITFDGQAVGPKKQLRVDGAIVRVTPPILIRKFCRGSFGAGGRLYGWWQTIPSSRRLELRFGGEPVAEADYAQLHAQIIYAQLGYPFEGDAYEFVGFTREQGKIALNILLNASSNVAAIGAISDRLPMTRANAARLLEAVKGKHRSIEGWFCADEGVYLQRLDSELMLDGLKICQRLGITALPVHDSMLAPRRDIGKVVEIMQSAFARHFPKGRCLVRVAGEGSTYGKGYR